VSGAGRLAVDVAVVGAGIAGVSAGAALAELGAAVAVLEAEDRPGHHATGRSVALFTETYGNEVVRRLAVASRPFLADPPAGFSAVPLLRRRGALSIGRSDQLDGLARMHAACSTLVTDLQLVDTDGALQLCPVLSGDYVAGGVWEPRAADIDVDALLGGYLRRLGRAGGTLVTGTRVGSVGRRAGRFVLEGGGVTVDAGVVVNGAGAWADEVGVLFGARPLGLVALRRTAFIFDAPGNEDPQAWPMVNDVDEAFYFKPDGGRLVGSPADETPSPAVDARPEEIDVATALDRIGTALGVELRHAHHPWAGLRTFAPGRTPVVGPDPDVDGLFWLAGQGGYGIQTAPAMAEATAGLVLAGDLSPALKAVGLRAADLAPARFGLSGSSR
jgi:D-arginine dehydrogenase